MIKKNSLIVFIAFFSLNVYAQQFPIYNHYFMNQSLFNPSLTGIGESVNATLIHKSYLTGISGNPKTLYLNLDAPAVENKIGLGLGLYTDQLGITNKMGVYGSCAYRAKFSDNHSLNLGFSLGLLQFGVNPDEIKIEDGGDPFLTDKNFKSSSLDGSFGATYINRNLQLGVGIVQLFGNKIKLTQDLYYKLDRNYILSAQYKFYFNESKKLALSPLLLVRYSNAPLPQEIALIFEWNKRIWAVPFYRNSGAIGTTLMVQVFDKFKIGYSYEKMVVNPVNSFENGAHEVMLGYSFESKGKSERRQQEQIDLLSSKIEMQQIKQESRDSLQDAILKKQEGDISQNKNKIDEFDSDLKKTQQELKVLKDKLIKKGIIKEFSLNEYDNAEAGYYIVIASVKDRRYNESAMQVEYLNKGYKQVYNKKRGWHYVYSQKVDNFSEALRLLKETRAGEHKDAWIHILK